MSNVKKDNVIWLLLTIELVIVQSGIGEALNLKYIKKYFNIIYYQNCQIYSYKIL